VFYPEYAIAEVREPRQPQNVDRYLFRGGNVFPPTPVPSTSINGPLDAKTFTRAQVALEAVPRLIADAPGRLGIAGAHPTHVIVERDTVFGGGRIVVRVYASTRRDAGYVEYDADGGLRKVVR